MTTAAETRRRRTASSAMRAAWQRFRSESGVRSFADCLRMAWGAAKTWFPASRPQVAAPAPVVFPAAMAAAIARRPAGMGRGGERWTAVKVAW